ncbi:MAG TPA: hypothetical protein VFR09_00200 [Alphaproteobacteria bacterium]|nr:hypothetical protein [Alphaproteobacteria bacterium]
MPIVEKHFTTIKITITASASETAEDWKTVLANKEALSSIVAESPFPASLLRMHQALFRTDRTEGIQRALSRKAPTDQEPRLYNYLRKIPAEVSNEDSETLMLISQRPSDVIRLIKKSDLQGRIVGVAIGASRPDELHGVSSHSLTIASY